MRYYTFVLDQHMLARITDRVHILHTFMGPDADQYVAVVHCDQARAVWLSLALEQHAA